MVKTNPTSDNPMEDQPRKRRIRLLLQYDGGPFLGWQHQPGGGTIQDAVEGGLERLLGERVRIVAAGRTDTGVHAMAMPVHFDTFHEIPAGKIAVAAGRFLPDAISILESSEAPADWDARRSARLRWYRYQVLMAPVRRPLGPRAWRVFRPLDLGAIERALAELRGRHDFSGFRSSQCQSRRTVLDLEEAAMRIDGELLAFDFKCRSFLHHMVRFMVGTLVSVGLGQIDLARLRRILNEGDRPQLVLCAPPEGLCLMAVGYTPEECDAIRRANPPLPSF